MKQLLRVPVPGLPRKWRHLGADHARLSQAKLLLMLNWALCSKEHLRSRYTYPISTVLCPTLATRGFSSMPGVGGGRCLFDFTFDLLDMLFLLPYKHFVFKWAAKVYEKILPCFTLLTKNVTVDSFPMRFSFSYWALLSTVRRSRKLSIQWTTIIPHI